jgi:RimJ/RimL family protein N-acetyltransferase
VSEFRHETERLVLRDWREEDWPEFWRVTNTPAVMRWLGGVLDAQGREASSTRMLGYRSDFGHTFWPVERREDGAILGFCGLKRCTDANGPFGMVEIGWRLREDAWGRGYAREAASATLELAFESFGADEVIALTVWKNESSWGLMRRLGMAHRPDLDFGQTHWSGTERETIVHSITKEQWENL